MGAILNETEKNNVTEIFQNMTVEEMVAMFYDKALIEPPYKVFQLNSKGYRYYYRINEFGEPEFYPSVTTIISAALPKAPFLEKWIIDKGVDEAERIKNDRACYGTFMHAQFEELIINGEYDLDGLKSKLAEFIEINKLPSDFIYYADDLKKDVLAFAQFVIDYEVKPLAVEISLVHPVYRYAGMIDLPCTMLTKPNGSERVAAIVDFKSGRKGFFEEHELQLHFYKALWNVNFPNVTITKVYNFSPKDWRKTPTYNLKDQSDSEMQSIMESVLNIAMLKNEQRSNNFCVVRGKIDLKAKSSLSNNILNLTLSDLVKNKKVYETPKVGITETELKTKETPKVEQPKAEIKADSVENKPKADTTAKKQVNTRPKKNEPKKATKTAQMTQTTLLLNSEIDF